MEDGNYFGDNQLLGLAFTLQQLDVCTEALIGGVGVCWVRGGHISGFDKNVKILYFVTKLPQGRQTAHKSVTDFPKICRDFHAEARECGTQMHLETQIMEVEESGTMASPSVTPGPGRPLLTCSLCYGASVGWFCRILWSGCCLWLCSVSLACSTVLSL